MALWATGEDVVLPFNAKNDKGKVNIELDLGDTNNDNSVESLQHSNLMVSLHLVNLAKNVEKEE